MYHNLKLGPENIISIMYLLNNISGCTSMYHNLKLRPENIISIMYLLNNISSQFVCKPKTW